MTARASHWTRFFLALAVCLLAGCQLSSFKLPWRDALEASADESAADEVAADFDGKPSHVHRKAGDAAHKPPVDVDLSVLTRDEWIPTLAPLSGERVPPGYHWTHTALEALVATPTEQRPQLQHLLASENKIEAGNAAIVLARWQQAAGDNQVVQRLGTTIRATELKLTIRCAAAESLALVASPAALDEIRHLLDDFGRTSIEVRARYVPQLHSALLVALAAHRSVGSEPYFAAALASPAPTVRVEMLNLWNAAAPRDLVSQPNQEGAQLPDQVLPMCDDDDLRVRIAALEALAAHHHPQARTRLTAALQDYDLNLRLAGIRGLGSLGTPEAREALAKYRHHSAELVRGAVVAAMAAAGGGEGVLLEAVQDKAWRVRQSAADALSKFAPEPPPRVLAVAEQLLHDPSTQVQQHAVHALRGWSLSAAGPLLLEALEESGYLARKAALEQLSERWPAAADFPLTGNPSDRTAAMTVLRAKWNSEQGSHRTAAASLPSPDAVPQVNPLRPEDDDAVQKALTVLADLRVATNERRAAAAAIAERGMRGVLQDVSLVKLVEVARREQDPAIWQALLAATAQDAREPATVLAYLAIGHDDAEVRRRACEYLAVHGEPRHVAVLTPMLRDPQPSNVAVAAKAIGHCRQLDNPRPLVDILLSSDHAVRLEAAISLSRLQVPSGVAALERLALDPDAEVRRRTALAIGELGDPALLPSLIPQLDDQPAVRKAALTSLAQLVGAGGGPADIPANAADAERARLWRNWYHAGNIPK